MNLISPDDFKLDGEESEMVIMCMFAGNHEANLRLMNTVTDLKRDLNAYLEDLEESEVRSLADVIDYNIKHADVELPPGW